MMDVVQKLFLDAGLASDDQELFENVLIDSHHDVEGRREIITADGSKQPQPTRKELAKTMTEKSQKLYHGQPEKHAVECEALCKIACILNPKDRNYKERWVKALALHPEDKRKALVDVVENVIQEIFPSNTKGMSAEHKKEASVPFYTDFINNDEVLSEARQFAHKKVVKKTKKAFAENMLETGQSIFDLTDKLKAEALQMDEETREQTGLHLSHQITRMLQEGQLKSEPVYIAMLHLSAAYIAHNQTKPFDAAKDYIHENVTVDALPDVAGILEGLRDEAQEESYFRTEATNYAQTLQAPQDQAQKKKGLIPVPWNQ